MSNPLPKAPVNLVTGSNDYAIQSNSLLKLVYYNLYSNNSGLVISNTDVGNNWATTQFARLSRPGNRIAISFAPGRKGRVVWFDDNGGGSFTGLFGTQSSLTIDSEGDYRLTELSGKVTVFDAVSGALVKSIATNGVVTNYTVDNQSLQLAEVESTFVDANGATVTDSRSFDYFTQGPNLGQLQYVTHTQSTAASGVEKVRRVELAYYDSLAAGKGQVKDLKYVHLQSYTGGSWQTTETQHFRYYTEDSDTGFAHGLKFALSSREFASFNNQHDPDTTADDDDLVAGFAGVYFEYDDQRRVSMVKRDGGRITNEMEYSVNPNPGSDQYNHWFRKATYTADDGSLKTVYSNRSGDDILVEDRESEDVNSPRWITYKKFNSSGRLIEKVYPSAITGYDESVDDLNVQIKSNEGLIEVTTWHANINKREYTKVKEGANGTLVNLTKSEYETYTLGGGTNAERSTHKVSRKTIYRSDTGAGDPVETTYQYEYGHADSLQPSKVTTYLPDVSDDQNGVNFPQNDSTVAEYDVLGRMTRQIDARGVKTDYQYDPATGAQTQMTQDVDGFAIVTNSTVDARGRTIEQLGPEHEVDGQMIRTATWTAYSGEFETWTAQGYQRSNGQNVLVNPINISRRSADGMTEDSIAIKRGSSVETTDSLATIANAGVPTNRSSWVRWSQKLNDINGRMVELRVYHDIPDTGEPQLGTHYTATSYDYDNMGRQNKIVSPAGTITRTDFNSRSLEISAWIGTIDDGTANNMVQLSEVEYDNGTGGGNGLTTKVTEKVNSEPANDRTIEIEYDWRNRLTNTVTTDGINVFHQVPTFDNLGRPILDQTFRIDAATPVLLAQSEQFYDRRGRSYQTKMYGVSDSGVLRNALVSNQWFDANDQLIKSSSPGSQEFTKTTYDALGRVTATYSAYYDGSGSDDPTSIANNVVLTESLSAYNDTNQVLVSTSKDRLHNATGNGSLAGPVGSGPKSRDSYNATWYDGVGRVTASANYGTNDNANAPTRAALAPASSDTVLVSQTRYDAIGQAFESIDPMGRVHLREFDDAGRSTKTFANFGGSETQTVHTLYNNASQLWKQISENNDTGDQITTYTYGVTLNDSELASNDLPKSLIHPDGGEVVYTLDRTGEQTSMTDPNGSTHQYEYDAVGRRTSDVVTNLGAGVDGSVRRIEHSFDNRKQLQNVTSFNSVAGGLVQSDIQYEYNDFGQITKEYQQHNAEVDTATSPAVRYDYNNGSANTLRPLSIIYPNGREIDYGYGSPDSQTNRLDRVETIEDGPMTLVSYQYAGSDAVVTQTYNQPGIEKTLNLGSGTDPYAALDRFGRVEELRWSKETSKKVHFEYGYDRNNNRLFERNQKRNTRSHLVSYDELNRMTSSQVGSLNNSSTNITSPSLDQGFTLDETGNFKGFVQSGSSATELNQTRVHNTVNEITDITETVGPVWATPDHDANGNMTVIPQPNELTNGFGATWDAWNRLIQVDDRSSLETVASYKYDGINRRIIVDTYDNGSPSQTRDVYYSLQSQALEERVDGSSDMETQFVWNLNYIDDLILRDRDTTGNGTFNQRLYALNDLRFSIVALVNINGNVVERFDYDTHGRAIVMDANFANRSAGSSYGWQFRYTGRRQDLDTGLYFFRARYYSAETGRFVSRDPLGFVDGMALYRAYFAPGAMDPHGTACEIQSADAKLRGKTWNFSKATVSLATEVRGKVKVCPICCDDDSEGHTVSGSLAFRGKFELAVASHRVFKTIRMKYFVGKIDGWAGIRLYGGFRGQVQFGVKYNSCTDDSEGTGKGYIGGYVGIEGGGELEFSGRVRKSFWGWKPSFKFKVGATIGGRLMLRWYPDVNCNRNTCTIKGPLEYQIRGYYKLRATVLGRGFSYTGGIETTVPAGNVNYSFENPILHLL